MFEEPILSKPEMGKKLTKLSIDIIILGIKLHKQSIEFDHFYTFFQLTIHTLRENEYGSPYIVTSLICTYT